MIIRTRRKNESLLARLAEAIRPQPVAPHPLVHSQEDFENEIAKETERSNRRDRRREFGLILFDFSDRQVNDKTINNLAHDFAKRLRISDTIGWFDLRLAVLLPETERLGAVAVANDLGGIATNHGVSLETSVSIYPWDDALSQVAKDLRQESNYVTGNKSFQDDDSTGGGTGGGSVSHSETVRHDQAHSVGKSHLRSKSSDVSRGDLRSDGDGMMATLQVGAGSATATATAPVAEAFTATQIASLLSPEAELELDDMATFGTGVSIQFCRAKTPVWKRAIDIFGSSVGILLLSPVFIGAAVAIKLSAPGPVFFRQMREGKDGVAFGILKFRTMVVDAEAKQAALREQSEQDGPAFKLKNDPRITKVGKYLRKSCIDELPQLFNVLMGQMSLVGPRPLPVGESQECSVWQRKRLSVLPGCTCIWQARGGRDIKFAQWMRMDLEYIRKRSLMYDLRLIFETVYLAVLHKGSV